MCQERINRPRAGMKSNNTPEQVTVVKMPRISESRKIRKPLMEKKRRARINDCLNELKRMLLEADAELKQPGSRPAKLEKADILELTVRHVRRLQCEARLTSDNSSSSSECSEDSAGARFKAGFSECAREVRSELSRLELGDESLQERLRTHLNSCLNDISRPSSSTVTHDDEVSSSSGSNSPPPLLPFTAIVGSKGYTLLPTKLANGDIAFVIPAELRSNGGNSSTSAIYRHSTIKVETKDETIGGPVWRPW